MVHASSYSAVAQRDDGASTASPASISAHTTSPSMFLSLSDHTFTPLSSTVGSDVYFTSDGDGDGDDHHGDEAEAEAEKSMSMGKSDAKHDFATSTSPGTDIDKGRRNAATTAPRGEPMMQGTGTGKPMTAVRGRGARAGGIVSSLVQSLDNLHATTAPAKGYEPVPTTKNILHHNNEEPESPCRASRNSSPSVSPLSEQFDERRDRDRFRQGDEEGEKENPHRAPHDNLLPIHQHHHDRQATAGAPWPSSASPTTSYPTQTTEAANLPSISTRLVRPKPRPLPSVSQPACVSSAFGPVPVRREVLPSPQPPYIPSSLAPIPIREEAHSSPEPLSAPAIPGSVPVTRETSIRAVSSASVPICHPSPDINEYQRSGACLENIAVLEATAERFSLTSSIEDAIREAHEQLKRSDSRRSSILRANSVRAGSEVGGPSLQTQLPVSSRPNSILGINTAARLGGYSPGGYVMSPTHSFSNASTRYRSASKTSSLGVPTSAGPGNLNMDISSEVGNGEDFPTFLSRHGTGKSSVRSVVSSKLCLVDIVETEPPMTLTQDALDEADRAAEAGDESEDEDTIRASAHQYVEEDPSMDADGEDGETPQAQVLQPMLHTDFLNLAPPPALQLHQPNSYSPDEYNDDHAPHERPLTAASGTTSEHVQNAFGDFDGVHCDPEAIEFPDPPEPELAPPPPPQQRLSRAAAHLLPPRPKSYFDVQTGQQMLYYPARVPAMLNLPPKLSKNNNRLSARQNIRSQVMSVIPQESRDSRVWLPDPLAGMGEAGAPFMTGGNGENTAGSEAEPSPATIRNSFIPDDNHSPAISQSSSFQAKHPSEPSPANPQGADRELKRPTKLKDLNRQSRLPGPAESDLPPQLRASVFFDLPPASAAPKIVVKDHSAMATLDSILDASASAPVNAFTDHAFAGKLGSEVYGVEKKKNRKSKAPVDTDHGRSVSLMVVDEQKKRGSFLSLLGGGRKSSENLLGDKRRTVMAVESPGTSSKDGQSPGVEQGPFSPNPMDPDSDEEPDKEEGDENDDEEDDEEEEEEVYQGRPTTLLAELQIRKQRNKMRTRPTHKVYPNGLHSTLLELDTVAQVERETRKGKKVNLAWEDPSANPDLVEEEDDEEVPLAMLAAARAAAAAKGVSKSTLDIGVVMDEVNRPLGLMERRELEENEPLSRRRERLQGRGGRETLNLDEMRKRMSTMNLNAGGNGLKTQSRLMLPLQSPGMGPEGSMAGDDADAEPEVEGETLAQRRKRLNGDGQLPRARPVSGAFSMELLNQFGEPEPEESNEKDKGKGIAVDNGNSAEKPEEEETLGQRRRRLQAEREAREREMGGGPMSPPADQQQRLSRRMSMADILTAHPLDTPQGAMHPREQERLRLEAEAERTRREQEARMAQLRMQMPRDLLRPSAGGYQGGHMGGRFNDGLAGAGLAYGNRGAAAAAPRMSVGVVPGQGVGVRAPYPTGMVGHSPATAGYHPGAYNPFSGIPPTQGQLDMVERWRQSIMP